MQHSMQISINDVKIELFITGVTPDPGFYEGGHPLSYSAIVESGGNSIECTSIAELIDAFRKLNVANSIYGASEPESLALCMEHFMEEEGRLISDDEFSREMTKGCGIDHERFLSRCEDKVLIWHTDLTHNGRSEYIRHELPLDEQLIPSKVVSTVVASRDRAASRAAWRDLTAGRDAQRDREP
jgi:hypothetical protein